MPCCCIGTSKSRRARISKFRQVSAGAGEVPPTSYHAGAGKAVSKFHRSHDIHVWCLPRREKQERGRRPGAAAPRSNGHSRKGKSDRNETFSIGVNVLFLCSFACWGRTPSIGLVVVGEDAHRPAADWR